MTGKRTELLASPGEIASCDAEMAHAESKIRKSVQSVETGVRVLAVLMDTVESSLQLKDVAERARLSRSQAHRYLLAYTNTGLVSQDPSSGRYSLGPLALRVGLSALSRLDVIKDAHEALARIVDETGYTGLIAVPAERGPTVVRFTHGATPLAMSLSLGSVLTLQGSSAGLLFLAFNAEARFREMLRAERARNEGPPSDVLLQILGKVRADGYAITEGSTIPGLTAVAAPVFDLQGSSVAAMVIIARSTNRSILDWWNIAKLVDGALDASSKNGWSGRTVPGRASNSVGTEA